MFGGAVLNPAPPNTLLGTLAVLFTLYRVD